VLTVDRVDDAGQRLAGQQAAGHPQRVIGWCCLACPPSADGERPVDGLLRRGLESPLPDETFVVYVSPLKALSNDIHRNLEIPLAGIRAELASRALPDVVIRTLVRTGDTPQTERAGMRKRPPHIVLLTTRLLPLLLTFFLATRIHQR